METVNRLTNVLVTMNTPPTVASCSKSSKCFNELMSLQFFEEAYLMDADSALLEYFIFSFTVDFVEIIQDFIADETK